MLSFYYRSAKITKLEPDKLSRLNKKLFGGCKLLFFWFYFLLLPPKESKKEKSMRGTESVSARAGRSKALAAASSSFSGFTFFCYHQKKVTKKSHRQRIFF
jgi:hypothetical protein